MRRIQKPFSMILLIWSILLLYSTSVGAEEAPLDGTPISVKIGSSGEVKWYSVQVPEGGTLRVQLHSIPEEDLGVRYQLFKDENGQPAAQPLDWVDIKESNYSGSPPSDSMDRAFHVPSGMYYIKLEGISYSINWVDRVGWSDTPFQMMVNLSDIESNESHVTATEIQDGATQEVRISASNDLEWYKINVSKTGALRVQLNSIPDEELGVKYQLFKDEDGQPSAQPLDWVDVVEDNYIGSPPSDSMDRTLQVTPGVYYIKLAGLSYDINWVYRKGWSDTPFQFKVNLRVMDDNGSYETATEIQDGVTQEVRIAASNDINWYKIHVSEDAALRVQLNSIPDQDLGIRYQLFQDENGKPATEPLEQVTIKKDVYIGSLPTDSMDRALRVSPGVYYIRLEGLAYDNHKGWSDIPFQVLASIFDHENNGNYETATEILKGETQQLQISAPNDKDWYKITVPEDGTLRIKLNSIPDQELGVKYQLFKDENGKPSAQPVDQVELKEDGYIGSLPTDSMDRTFHLASGTYYIKLEGLTYDYSWVYRKGWSVQSFTLKGEFLDPENNETPSHATVLNVDGSETSLMISARNDVDYYKIMVPTNSSLRLDLKDIPINDLGVKVELYKDVNGVPAATPISIFNGDQLSETAIFQSIKVYTGTYYLKISGTQYSTWITGWSDQSFRLQAKFLDPESNETYQTATEVIPNGEKQAIMISAVDDQDWYKVIINEPSALRFGVSAVPIDDMSLKMELYEVENGAIKNTPLQSAELWLNQSAMERSVKVYPGTYYLKLTGTRYYSWDPGWSEQSFWLETEAFDFEKNETKDQATPLQNETSLNGYISYPGDIDWYVMDVPYQGLMQVEANQGYHIYREDSGGTLVEMTETGLIPVDQGQYYFKFNSEDDAYWSTTPYNLNVTLMAYLYTEVGHNQVALSWDPEWEAESYTVLRQEGEGEFAAIDTLDGEQRSFIDEGITDYHKYQYMITATGSLMNRSQTKQVVPNDIEHLLYKEQTEITYSEKDWSNKLGLGTGEELRFYPGGPYVYYLRGNTLYRNDMNGSTEIKIAEGIDSLQEFDVSPDGNLLYAIGNKLYQASGSGLSQTELPTDQAVEITEARWLVSAGQHIGYIYSTGEEQVLKYFEDDRFFPFGSELSFSPDGLLTLKPDTAGADDGTSEYEKTELYLIGSEAKKIKEWEMKDNGFFGQSTDLVSVVWSSDGSLFALQTDETSYTMSVLTGQRSYTTTTQVELYDRSGTKLTTLFTDYSSSNGSGNYLRGAGDKLVLEHHDQVLVRDFSAADGWVELSPPSPDMEQIIPVGEIEVKPPFSPDVNGDGIVDILDVVQAAKKNPQDVEKVIASYGKVQ